MKIPVQMQPVYEEIAGMIEEYCEKYMNEEYRVLCLRLLEKLCRKRPSPLLKGRRNTWAAGIVYAIAANNFIFDKSMPIHLTADELSRPFGIAPSTAGNKAAEIRKLVRMSPWDTEWLLQELECVSKYITATIMQEEYGCKPDGRRQGSGKRVCRSEWQLCGIL